MEFFEVGDFSELELCIGYLNRWYLAFYVEFRNFVKFTRKLTFGAVIRVSLSITWWTVLAIRFLKVDNYFSCRGRCNVPATEIVSESQSVESFIPRMLRWQGIRFRWTGAKFSESQRPCTFSPLLPGSTHSRRRIDLQDQQSFGWSSSKLGKRTRIATVSRHLWRIRWAGRIPADRVFFNSMRNNTNLWRHSAGCPSSVWRWKPPSCCCCWVTGWHEDTQVRDASEQIAKMALKQQQQSDD